MRLIRAALCREFGKPLSVETVHLRAPGPGEVEVRIAACAVCHSDVSFAQGDWGGALPAVYGHEAAGWVSATGPGVGGLRVGDPVVVTMIRACGTCPSCGVGKPTICETPYDRRTGPLSMPDGSPVEHGLSTGAFAEFAVVHESQVVPIPEHLPMEVASLLGCGVITGVGAVVNTAKVHPGSSVVVIGAGGVGLNTIQGALVAGAARIIAVDMTEEKLATARAFGATDGVLATECGPHRHVRALTGGRGADYVFVTVGSIPAYEGSVKFLAPGGRMIMVGMPPSGAKVSYEPVMAAAVNHGFLGSKLGESVIQRDIPWLVDLYQQGRLKLDELISARYPLEGINEAFADCAAGRVRRGVILFGDTD